MIQGVGKDRHIDKRIIINTGVLQSGAGGMTFVGRVGTPRNVSTVCNTPEESTTGYSKSSKTFSSQITIHYVLPKKAYTRVPMCLNQNCDPS